MCNNFTSRKKVGIIRGMHSQEKENGIRTDTGDQKKKAIRQQRREGDYIAIRRLGPARRSRRSICTLTISTAVARYLCAQLLIGPIHVCNLNFVLDSPPLELSHLREKCSALEEGR